MKFLFCGICFLAGFVLRAPAQPASLAYLLQADSFAKSKTEAVEKLASCDRDWIVLDANFSTDEPWTTNDLSAIRAGKPGRKIIAYLSIGEAENYRTYWQSFWSTNAPTFLLGENPEWKGNFRVKYWQADWQKIILTQVDQFMVAGFDGVYLDIVDGFETFEQDGKNYIDDRLNSETKQSYRRDMVDWVKQIAARARAKNSTAIVIPQNGTQLLAQPDFLATIDAVGVEDLFSNGKKPQKSSDTKFILECLLPLIASHKPVLDVEYASKIELREKVKTQAKQNGFVWVLTDRQLKTLGESGR
jgi:cysteinyl-tRNA synthetase, unknown class